MVAPRKYNPGFLSDDELVGSFCVRTTEFESIMEMLGECTGASNPHQIVIGPRGSGKTTLLLRVAAEVRRDPVLSESYFPVVFAEESYEVGSAGEFWLECLGRLAVQAPEREGAPDLHRTYGELRTIRDDRALGDRCLGALLDFSDREGKRLVVIAENLNSIFRDIRDPDAGWRIRKVLQTEPRIVLLASATSRFDEIDNPDQALYELFRVLMLRPLSEEECVTLWEGVTGQTARREAIRALRILVGGSPRLFVIFGRFGADLSFRQLMADLLDLVDDHTEYFRSHLEVLAPQERRVYLALADLWKPATTREIADGARIQASKCSAQLARLVDRQIVRVVGGTARRKEYYLAERLYSIYHLLRRPRGPDRLVESLIRFMAAYYSPRDLTEIGARIVRAADRAGGELPPVEQAVLAQLLEVPTLGEGRPELLRRMPPRLAEALGPAAPPAGGLTPDASGAKSETPAARLDRDLLEKARALRKANRPEDALAAYDDLVRRFRESQAPDLAQVAAEALAEKVATLAVLNRPEQALAASDEMSRRFGTADTPRVVELVVGTLLNRAGALRALNRGEEAVAVYDEVVRRHSTSERPELLVLVVGALASKGTVLRELNRLDDALAAYDEVIYRFSAAETPAPAEAVASSLSDMGEILGELNRPREAVGVLDEVVSRYGTSEVPRLRLLADRAMANKAIALHRLGRSEEALAVLDDLTGRYGTRAVRRFPGIVAEALLNRGLALAELNRPEEAVKAHDELVRRFGAGEEPEVLTSVANALMSKGVGLAAADRPKDALAAFEEVVHRFGESRSTILRRWVAGALVNKGATLAEMMNRPEDALAAFDDVVRRCGESESPALVVMVAVAFLNKGAALARMQRLEDAAAAYGEAARRFAEETSRPRSEFTERALLQKARLELRSRRYGAAIRTADHLLERPLTDSPENRIQSLLVRARATLASGDVSGCEKSIEALLAILPRLDSVPGEPIHILIELGVELGPVRMLELIRASPAADLLLPLSTAFEQELGLKSRVAREVERVARDIRRRLAQLQEGR